VLLPDNALLATANINLQSAEADFAQRTFERDQAAQLQARIQKVRDQANANDIDQAIASLEALRADLPANHDFLGVEGPQVIAQAYIRRAETDERAGLYDSALAVLDRAADFAPGFAPLLNARDRILREIEVVETPEEGQDPGLVAREVKERADNLKRLIETALNRSGSLDVASLAGDLITLRDLSPDDYTVREIGLAAAAVARLDDLRDASPSAAQKRLDDLRQLFPGQQVFLTYTLPQIVVEIEDRCSNPAFPGRGSDSRAVCRDTLTGGKSGPRLVVVPAGGPVAKPFAITKYEITLSEYNTYCDLSESCSRKAGEPALPLTNVSLAQAQAYAQWLSTTTGFEYRLPSPAEWQYAAEAPGTTAPPRNYNCLLREGGRVTKGQQLQDVRTGESNGWGLQNYVGNAREWVVESQGIWALGGSHRDAFSACSVTLRVPHDGQADAVTGFRLVREVTDSS